MQFINNLVVAAIRIYQKVTENKKHKCLHYPSCSNYTILAYKKYSFLIATKKALNRIQDCHPFSNRKFIDYP